MEENERENMENPAETRENPASSDPSVAPGETTGDQRRRENDAAREQQREDRKKQKLALESSLHGNEKYQGKFPWIMSVLIFLLALILAGALYLLGLREIHMAELKPYTGAYDSWMIRQGNLEAEGNGDWVVLRKRGKAEVRFNEQRQKGKWNLEGRNLTLKLKGKTYRGTLDSQVLTLQVGEQELIFLEEHLEMPEPGETLAAAETQPPETEAQFMELPPAELMYDGWAGNYYGWWIRKEPGESWHSGQEFAFWDVCGTLTPTAADRAALELWDSQCQPGERLCSAQVRFTPGITAAGTMIADSGTVLGEALSPEAWSVDPGNEPIPRMLTIGGSTGTEDYLIFLRPWGMEWEDVNDYPGRFFADMMPAHYTDWYQPRMEEEMPEYFVGLVFPEIDRE